MTTSAYEYKVGGSLPADAPTYVWRQADYDLFNHLKSGTFCYVLHSRQMGKSSLRVQTMGRLQEAGIACTAIDLTEIVSPDISRSEFYGSITYTLADSFNLLEQIGGFESWWCKYEVLPPIQRLSRFIKEVLLTHETLFGKNIVIFVDEVDSILRLPFPVSDFFGLIRACYNNRADQPEYNRLTLAILGVASPSDLIREANHSPPFNFGQAIELNGFQLQEAEPIAKGLKVKSRSYKKLLAAVLSWTGGQPFLTQKLCKLIVDSEDTIPRGGEAEWVEKLVRSRVIENWESSDEPEHLRTIRDRLLRRGEQRIVQLLKLYQQILRQGGVAADDSSEQMELRLSGLVVKRSGKLIVGNRIYESVFDRNWVEKALTAIQPDLDPRDSEFLTKLNELERKLLVDHLANVANGRYSARALYEVVRDITLQVGDLLGADRATIFLLNDEKTELWSIVAENEGDEFLDIQVQLGEGIAGQAAKFKKVINIPDSVYEDSRCDLVKAHDQKFNYRTYNVLAFPILSENQDIVAVVQLLNKLKLTENPQGNLSERIEPKGFTKVDEERLGRFVAPIRRILEICQSYYKANKKLRATAALAEATRSLDKSSLDTKEILQRVMDAAKKLMNADRSTLWLIDRDRRDIWTNIPQADGTLKEMRVEMGVGFVGRVAQSGEIFNIGFDLYDHPDAANARKFDQETGYRTCSLLCMPVYNAEQELIGVTQLVNKKKSGEFPPYNPSEWPQAPEQFKASFDESDRQSMQVFNERAGVILQYAKTHETLKQLAQIQSKEVVHNALAMLSNAAGNQSDEDLYNALYNMLNFMTLSIGKLMEADRTTIFLWNAEQNEFWSLIVEDEETGPTEIRIPEIVASKSKSRKSPPSLIQTAAAQIGRYSIYNILKFPLVNRAGNLVAIVEVINKLKSTRVSGAPLSKQIDRKGFTKADEELLDQRAESIIPILEGCQSFYREIRTIQGQRAIDALWSAIASISQSSWNTQVGGLRQSSGQTVSGSPLIRHVMEAAKKLTNADRSTLWLVDRDRGDLWTEVAGVGELRCKIGVGYAGECAQTRQPMIIPFDLYDHVDAVNAKKTDKETRYRTCSLLCMPVLSFDGELLGVTQLLNKRKHSNFPEYNPADWPKVPDYFKASFNERDKRYMELFNNQVGVVLQNAQQQDILRN